jgi:WD40 repeat protein
VKEIKLEASVTKLVAHDKTLFAVDEALVISMLRKGRVVKKLSGHTGKIRCMAFLGDSMFSGSEDKTLRRWNVHNGLLQEVLQGHTDSVVDLRACPEQGRLFSASDDGTVREWTYSSEITGAVQAVSDRKIQQEAELEKVRKLMKVALFRLVVFLF